MTAVVTSAPPSERPKTPCISPLPYDLLPTTLARQLSCSAPASTSLEEAERPLTHTSSGAVHTTPLWRE